MVFQQKLLEKAYFIFKLTGRTMVRAASSDKKKSALSIFNFTISGRGRGIP